MGCGISRNRALFVESQVGVVQYQAQAVPDLCQENLDTLTGKGERQIVVIQTRLNPDEEPELPSSPGKPIDTYGYSYSEKFGNAREDTEVVSDTPANAKKKPETPEGSHHPIDVPIPLKPILPTGPATQLPKAVFKSSEKPLFAYPVIVSDPAPPRLPSEFFNEETLAPVLKSNEEQTKRELMDELLREIDAM